MSKRRRVPTGTLQWINSFLSNRTQTVSVNGSHSSPANVISGVPQGSVLGPVLFLLYINNITDSINSNIRLFADDSILCREIQTPKDHDVLQTDLNKLSKNGQQSGKWTSTLQNVISSELPKNENLAISPIQSQTNQSPKLNHTLI
jgi:hypothetical protein